MFTIRRCRTPDVPDVLAFLETHWKPRHIFTFDRALFDWQYARPDRPGEYNIAIARRDADGALVGMLGFLPTRRFDSALDADNAIWLALWKVRDDVPGPLGLRLLSDVTDNEPHTSVGVIGFQPPVAAIYQALKFQVGELRHYVLPNPDVSTFALASFDKPPHRPVPETDVIAEPVDDDTFVDRVAGLGLGLRSRRVQRKTPEYFRARLLRHPIYRYSAFVLLRVGRTGDLFGKRSVV